MRSKTLSSAIGLALATGLVGIVATLAFAGETPQPPIAPQPQVDTAEQLEARFDGTPRQLVVGSQKVLVGAKRGAPDQSCVLVQLAGWAGPAGGCGPTQSLATGFMLTIQNEGSATKTIAGVAPAGLTTISVGGTATATADGLYIVEAPAAVDAVVLTSTDGKTQSVPVGAGIQIPSGG
jgi:hypothetical protein